jgi:PH/SEC7 domain-containing protein
MQSRSSGFFLVRHFCSKLYLKAETQQVDRILAEFSRRYWDCNPTSLYGSASEFLIPSSIDPHDTSTFSSSGVVHSVAYSLLLLNTDLHVAKLNTRMSRSQFVRNTLAAIQIQLQPTTAHTSATDLSYDDCSVRGSDADSNAGAVTVRNKRSGSIASWNSIPRDILNPTSPSSGHPSNNSSLSIHVSSPDGKTPTTAASSVIYGRNFENELESLLKVSRMGV